MNANMNENRYVRERRWAIIFRNVKNQQKKRNHRFTYDNLEMINERYISPQEKKKLRRKRAKSGVASSQNSFNSPKIIVHEVIFFKFIALDVSG